LGFEASYLGFAGGLRLRDVSLPEDEDDRDLDLEPDADEEPVYEYEPVVTDGDVALGFPVDFAISPTLLPPSLPFRFLTCLAQNPMRMTTQCAPLDVPKLLRKESRLWSAENAGKPKTQKLSRNSLKPYIFY
jgi:hypothetical protein